MAKSATITVMTKKIVRKVNTGDSLTDRELHCAVNFYEELAERLSLLGLEFKHAWNAAYRTYDALQYFVEARKRG